ncbi:hypothetical protein [Rhodococcus opacus]|uniref:hypothetical protein n=1 Tax=Rhodococcus opacus TaxID=37919 RepID=UPI002472EDAB|nr:hypothetical protein [Rhodococcus opacus]MDH6288084.1 hypothetical protein [Rhodococcus opacus]
MASSSRYPEVRRSWTSWSGRLGRQAWRLWVTVLSGHTAQYGSAAAAEGWCAAVLRGRGLSGTFGAVPRSVLLQLVCVLALVALGTMLLAVGSFGSGVIGLVGGAIWFWRLYRASDRDT